MTYIGKEKHIQNSCRVRRESLGELVDVVSKVVVVRDVVLEGRCELYC